MSTRSARGIGFIRMGIACWWSSEFSMTANACNLNTCAGGTPPTTAAGKAAVRKAKRASLRAPAAEDRPNYSRAKLMPLRRLRPARAPELISLRRWLSAAGAVRLADVDAALEEGTVFDGDAGGD